MISATLALGNDRHALGSRQRLKRIEPGLPALARFAAARRETNMKKSVVSVLLLCSCYTYRNTAVGDAALMTPVRVELTEEGSQEITKQVGPRGSVLEGVLAAKSDSALIFGVTALTRTNGVEETWHGEHVTVPASSVSRIQLRKLSRLNTGLFLAGLLAGGFLLKTAADAGNVIRTPGGPPAPGQ
jgi:hypothetical protein